MFLDYAFGFTVLLALSLVHVVLEFPLNSLPCGSSAPSVKPCDRSPSPRVRLRKFCSRRSFLFYFLPLFFIVYCVTPGIAAKNLVLLLASLAFYARAKPASVLLLAAQIVLNYAAALIIDACAGRGANSRPAAATALNLAQCSACSNMPFLRRHVECRAAGRRQLCYRASRCRWASPSSPSIRSLSDRCIAARSASATAAGRGHIAMFPQLVAGPIIRYHTISRRLAARRMTLGRASAGFRIFLIGLAQKTLIADEVARIAEAVFDKAANPGFAEAWLGLAAYTVQIYFDFAGYSNMAIGLGLALGFAFPRNFALPYPARSITAFCLRLPLLLSPFLLSSSPPFSSFSPPSPFSFLPSLFLPFSPLFFHFFSSPPFLLFSSLLSLISLISTSSCLTLPRPQFTNSQF